MKKGGTARCGWVDSPSRCFSMWLLFVRRALAADQCTIYRHRLGHVADSQTAHKTCGSSRWQAGRDVAANEAWYAKPWRTTRAYLHPVRPQITFNLVDGLIRMSFF